MRVHGRVRHLLLVRHGQYDLDSSEKSLTELGREQARRLGERLAAMEKGRQKDRYGEVPVHYGGIWTSDVRRALETVEIVADLLPDVPLHEPDPLLAEGMPTVPHPTSRAARIRPADIFVEGSRVEAGFRKYVHRDVDHKRLAERMKREAERTEASGGKKIVGATKSKDAGADASKPEHVYEIYICHMNVIRYFVMRALQLPPEAWLRLRGDNTGITELVIQPDGRVTLARFADTGHLPIEMITFN